MAPKNENDPKAWSKVSTRIVALIAAQKKKKYLNLNAGQAVWQLAEGYGLEERRKGNKAATPSPPFNQNLAAIWLPHPHRGHSLCTVLLWKDSRYQECHPHHCCSTFGTLWATLTLQQAPGKACWEPPRFWELLLLQYFASSLIIRFGFFTSELKQ